MSTANNSTKASSRTDIRVLDGHNDWRGVYALLNVDPSIEPTSIQSDAGAHQRRASVGSKRWFDE